MSLLVTSSLDSQVVSRILDVLNHSLSVDDFEEWLVSAAWNDQFPSSIASEADHLLAEGLSDERLRAGLEALVASNPMTTSSGSGSLEEKRLLVRSVTPAPSLTPC